MGVLCVKSRVAVSRMKRRAYNNTGIYYHNINKCREELNAQAKGSRAIFNKDASNNREAYSHPTKSAEQNISGIAIRQTQKVIQ